MAAGYTPNGLNKQTPGTNDNAWGDVLNDEVIQLVDEFVAGRASFTLSGTKTLTSTNGVSNEARMAILHVTGGTGGDVVIPARSKLYLVFNQASGDVRLAPSGGTAGLKLCRRPSVLTNVPAVSVKGPIGSSASA